MNNVIEFKKQGIPGKSRAEATPSGINFMKLSGEGVYQQTCLIEYPTAVLQLEDGQFDHALADGMRVLAEIHHAESKNWFTPSDLQRAVIWRWIVACLFITELWDENGAVEVKNEDGGIDRGVIYEGQDGRIVVYPATTRFSLASHIESLAIEKYGTEAGLKVAIRLYQGMTGIDPEGGLQLSAMGHEGLSMLHDGFIQQLNTEGMPPMPTEH
jgi:hypothetical protein